MTATVNVSISKEFLESIKEKKLYDNNDVSKISLMTKEAGLNKGKGYGNEHVRNFLLRQFTCSKEVMELIINYYEAKHSMIKDLNARQQKFIKQLS
jgi:hypothetical protein